MRLCNPESHAGKFKIIQIQKNYLSHFLHFLETVNDENTPAIRRSSRVPTPNKKYEYIQNMLSTSRRTPSKEQINDQSQDDKNASISEDDDACDENRYKPLIPFFNDKTDVAGGEIYGFNTPKKRGGMKILAENTPKTPVSSLKTMTPSTPKTPSTALRTLSLDPTRTPKTPHISALRTQQKIATPSETRNQNKRALQKRAQKSAKESESESSADEHSDYEAEDSSESSDEETADTSSDEESGPEKLPNARKTMPNVTRTVQLPTRTSARGRPKKKTYDDDFIPDSDNYFIAASNKKVRAILTMHFEIHY